MRNKLLVPIIAMLLLTACSTGKYALDNNRAGKSDNEIAQTESSEPVVVINNKEFTEEALDFYTLMNRLSVHLHRYEDERALSGDKLTEKLAYWDEQLSQYNHFNVNLQSLIELNAMALLAEEKGYYIPEKDLKEQVADFRGKIETVAVSEQLIDQYGKDKYDAHINEYVRLSMLKGHVLDDLRKDVKGQYPDMSENELNFMLHEQYEDLYMDQVSSLDIHFNVNGSNEK